MTRDIRHFARSVILTAAETFQPAGWRPPADIYRLRRGWLVKLDLAGVRPQDVQLGLAGRTLSIRGVRRDWQIEEGASCYSMEIAYSGFERTIEFPCELNQMQLATEYRDGMLLVQLTCEEESR